MPPPGEIGARLLWGGASFRVTTPVSTPGRSVHVWGLPGPVRRPWKVETVDTPRDQCDYKTTLLACPCLLTGFVRSYHLWHRNMFAVTWCLKSFHSCETTLRQASGKLGLPPANLVQCFAPPATPSHRETDVFLLLERAFHWTSQRGCNGLKQSCFYSSANPHLCFCSTANGCPLACPTVWGRLLCVFVPCPGA